MTDPLLQVENLHTVFKTREGQVHAVNGVSFTLERGELLGVVGESGSGKSVTMMSLVKLLPMPPAEITEGRVRFTGRDVLSMTDDELCDIRGGDIGFVFQDPMTSLNPVFTVGFQLIEALRNHTSLKRKAARLRAAELLTLVGIPDAAARLRDYPHQFSGGMRQRVMIAMALACEPELLIADEPTTALDVTIQAQILELVRELRRDRGMGIIWITHDLGVIAGIADRVVVMYAGQIVEHASVETLFAAPAHPYTRALLDTLPNAPTSNDADDDQDQSTAAPRRLHSIVGQPPSLAEAPAACSFAPRCLQAHERCWQQNPALTSIGQRHDVACWLHIDAVATEAASA